MKLVPELLRLEYDREGGIACDIDPLERVHLNGYAKAHGQALVSASAAVTLPHVCEMARPAAGDDEHGVGAISSFARMKRGARRSAATATRRNRHSSSEKAAASSL